jgi:S1-C subfamily serine protease
MKLYINWFDIAIFLFLLVTIWQAKKNGLVTQFLTAVLFFFGLFFWGWLLPRLLHTNNQTSLAILNGTLVLTLATILALAGYLLGRRFHQSSNKKWRQAEVKLSVGLSVGAGLITIWMVATMIGRLPFAGFSNSANDALTIQLMDRYLPPLPYVFAEFNHQLNSNNPVQTFTRTKFQTHKFMSTTAPEVKSVADMAEKSVVRMTSFGCGGIVSGSGFVVAPELVLTNAHVIAGVHRPIIKYGSQSYKGVPVVFDSDFDLAFLHVKGLKAQPLQPSDNNASNGATVVIIGYPGGNYTVLSSAVIDKSQVVSTNIYGVDTIDRLAYEVQTPFPLGSSGSPMLLTNGKVAGIIFGNAESLDKKYSFGLALPSSYISDELRQAESSTRRVGTGACLAS